jgi:hypothetical protein
VTLLVPGQVRAARSLGAVLLLAAALVGRPATAEDTPAGAPTTQQLIVKFKMGTEGDHVAAQAMQDQARQPAVFTDLAASLSGEIGMPLRIAAVTSGRELVMSVDAAAVTSAVIADLTKRPDVVRAAPLDANITPQVNPPDPAIEVVFADDSAIAKSLADGRADLKDDPEMARLSQDVKQETGVSLVPRRPQAPIVTFTIEVSKLTAELTERLKKRSDVAYVEPVRLLQPLPQ